MAIITKMINGHGPYRYRVTYENGEHHWEYLGPVEGEGSGSDEGATSDGSGSSLNPVENPTKALEQQLDELGIDANVSEYESPAGAEHILVEAESEEDLEAFADAIKGGEIDGLDKRTLKQQTMSVYANAREASDNPETTMALDESEVIEATLPTEEYDSETAQDASKPTVRLRGIEDSQYGEKATVEIGYDHKDKLKNIDWDKAHPNWDGNKWTIDADAAEYVEEELEEKGLEVVKDSVMQAYLDLVDD